LQHEQNGDFAGVLLAPNLFAIANIIQFDANAKVLAMLYHAAREYRLHAKCVADLLEIRCLPLEWRATLLGITLRLGNRARLLLMLSVIPSEM
jgi:putative oxidoreductase